MHATYEHRVFLDSQPFPEINHLETTFERTKLSIGPTFDIHKQS